MLHPATFICASAGAKANLIVGLVIAVVLFLRAVVIEILSRHDG